MKTTTKLTTLISFCLVAFDGTAVAASPKVPTFFARNDYAEGSLTNNYAQVGDVNGDGIRDLVTLGNSGLTVWFGNGDGTFRFGRSSSSVPAVEATTFVLADLNRDGKLDVVLPNPLPTVLKLSSYIAVALGNGDGTFKPVVQYPLNEPGLNHVAVGDFNGDGVPDVVATGRSAGVWLLTGIGDGTFHPAQLTIPLLNAFNISVADLNGDGKLDLVVTAPAAGGGFDIFFGNGDGTFATPQVFTLDQGPVALAVGPLTRGGPPGIAVNWSGSNSVYLYFGDGKGAFSGPRIVTLPAGYRDGLSIGDMNGDGIPDLLSAGNTGPYTSVGAYIAYGEGAGNYTAPVDYPIEGWDGIGNALLADLRGIGRLDVVTSGDAAISVLLNTGKGLLEDGIWTKVTGGATCGASADFNGDGKPDLAVNTPTGISILLGTGSAALPFAAGTPIAAPGAGCLITVDLNGDGIPDLLSPIIPPGGDGSTDLVAAWLGNGRGNFTLRSITSVTDAGFLVAADFNHDGKLDFAASGNLLALGKGDGTFKKSGSILGTPPIGGFPGIATGDINNDGWPDLVMLQGPQSDLMVLLNNQHGGFILAGSSNGLQVGGQQPILTDLNGDGNPDLIVAEAGSASLYLGDGTGTFTFLTSSAGLPRFEGLAFGATGVADVNGDGVPDVLVTGSDTLYIYLGVGDGTYANPLVVGTGPSPGSILVENLHGQSPIAGLPDIVVPDTSGGVLVLTNLTQ